MRLHTSAQISMFVIIGVIILILGIGVFLTLSSTTLFEDESPSYKVQEFTQSCLELQSKYALQEVAKKGGWYYLPNDVIFAQEGNFNEMIESSRGFEHAFYGDLRYWDYYDDSSGSMKQEIPTLDDEEDQYSIKNQVERLILETIDDQCLEDYSSFRDRFDIDARFAQLNITSTSFEDNQLTFELFLPLTIESEEEGGADSINRFQITIENSIKTPYYIANDIVQAQEDSSFIEHSYLDFIYNYQQAGDDDLLPPFYDFRYGETDYSVIYSDDKKPLLQQVFNTHSPEIIIQDVDLLPYQRQNVIDTQNSELRTAQAHQRELFTTQDYNLNAKGLRREYGQYTSQLSYNPFFPISFSFSNGDGGGRVLTHDVTNELLLIVPIQYTTYQAGYDITTPVVYEITNSNQNPELDLTFNLPMEINIRNNNPIRVLLNDNISTNSLSTESNSYSPSYCGEEHFISEDVNLNIREKDKFGDEVPVEDVEFRFTCSTQEEVVCPVETLSSQERLNYQQYTLNLPINCPNSQVEIFKDDYISQEIEVSPSLNNEITQSVTFNKPRTFEFDFSVRGQDVGENQQSFILFEPQNNPQYIQSYSLNSTTDHENLNITLIPDTYTITSFTFDQSTQVIPKKPGTSCGTFDFGCEPTPDIPSITLDGWILSDFKLEGFTITQDDLQFANRVSAQMPGVFYPQTYDDFDQNMPRSDEKFIKIQ
ncbi:MAG: hypothetical protein ACLFPL_04595 [Candidatus Nanoarchaeia archaeon]